MRCSDFVQSEAMTTDDVRNVDVTISHAHSRDVSDWNDGDWLTTTTEAIPADTPGCRLYSFVISSLLIGFLIVFGFVGNCTAFLVFQRDTLKTSTSFLFQASRRLFYRYSATRDGHHYTEAHSLGARPTGNSNHYQSSIARCRFVRPFIAHIGLNSFS